MTEQVTIYWEDRQFEGGRHKASALCKGQFHVKDCKIMRPETGTREVNKHSNRGTL